MNRADLLYEALKDGRPRSRREIFDRVGYMLTNNAASELRARGFVVQHSKEGRVDVYRLLDGDGGARGGVLSSAVSVEQPDSPVSRAGCSTSGDTSAKTCSSHVAGNGTAPPASPEQSAPVWLAHGPATSPSPGGSVTVGSDWAGAEQLSIEDEAAA